ncbi:hypothetical protein [Nocardia thailandica]|uniref:hypothetical protein n=1 Tax=Nocardia thailandica TaxID=257275 RepID=UPI000300906C|nr:hypothetical protein [Nocardia thailandica]
MIAYCCEVKSCSNSVMVTRANDVTPPAPWIVITQGLGYDHHFCSMPCLAKWAAFVLPPEVAP